MGSYRRRRRKGLDEERKRELRHDLRNYFLWSKNLSLNEDHQTHPLGFREGMDSEAATSKTDQELDPQAQLERARKYGFNFADISMFPTSSGQDQFSQDSSTPEKKITGETEDGKQKPSFLSEDRDKQDPSKPQEEEQSPYSRYVLEQMEQIREQQNQELYSGQVQYLVDLPAAIESDNRDLGHAVKAFVDPFVLLKELLWMAVKQNPELDVIQRLWLVWAKWSNYYLAWSWVSRGEYRYLPGQNLMRWGDRQGNDYQHRGIHQLETYHLENAVLQAMRWEDLRRSSWERQFNPVPNLHQLHGYFVGLRRRHWDSASWQYRPNLVTRFTMAEEDDELLDFTTSED